MTPRKKREGKNDTPHDDLLEDCYAVRMLESVDDQGK